jgi:LiaF transmembrane domain
MNELEFTPATEPARRPAAANSRLIFGLVLAGLGLFFLLDRFDLIRVHVPWGWWPLLLVALGVGKVLGADARRDPHGGAWLTFVGVWLILNFQGYLGFTWENSWPVFLVMGGAMIIWGTLTGRDRRARRRRLRRERMERHRDRLEETR